MNTTRLRQARALFRNDIAPTTTVRHNMRAWVRSVRLLGDRWHLAKTYRLVRVK
jgi:hypothetical protein